MAHPVTDVEFKVRLHCTLYLVPCTSRLFDKPKTVGIPDMAVC